MNRLCLYKNGRHPICNSMRIHQHRYTIIHFFHNQLNIHIWRNRQYWCTYYYLYYNYENQIHIHHNHMCYHLLYSSRYINMNKSCCLEYRWHLYHIHEYQIHNHCTLNNQMNRQYLYKNGSYHNYRKSMRIHQHQYTLNPFVQTQWSIHIYKTRQYFHINFFLYHNRENQIHIHQNHSSDHFRYSRCCINIRKSYQLGRKMHLNHNCDNQICSRLIELNYKDN